MNKVVMHTTLFPQPQWTHELRVGKTILETECVYTGNETTPILKVTDSNPGHNLTPKLLCLSTKKLL